MTSNRDQIEALLKKEWLVLKGTKNYLFQEIFSPAFSLYFIWYTSNFSQSGGMDLSPMSIPCVLGRVLFAMSFNVVQEKSQNFKEYLRVNGASLLNYIMSIFLFYFARAVFALAIMYIGVLAFFANEKASFGDHLLGMLGLLLYAIAVINFSLALTTLFSSPRLATQASSLLVFLQTFVYYAIVRTPDKWAYYLGSLLPPVACFLGFSDVGLNKPNPADFTPGEALIMQVINCFLYFGLYVLLDSVVPSDSGIKDPIFKWGKSNQVAQESNRSQLDLEGGINNTQPLLTNGAGGLSGQDISSAEHHENFDNQLNLKRTVFVENLSKVFGENVAVDRVTLPMFERQIFCLLGHNGAGKTTTINMMTGMLRPDGGRILYDGEDFAYNFETIRRKFGLCVQKDILYENLTVAEHIEIIARLRGVPKHEMERYIPHLCQKVGIPDEINKQSKMLSGGNKRKLSLALAIAGETKVVFLDEPTSGLDPNARRNFWDLVRSLRDEGRTILLTTHNLDEADELADRVGIMSKGKLLILGTSNFLKKRYGVGYNLILTPKPQELEAFHANKERYINQVKSVIHTSELDAKTSADMIKMALPYHETQNFADLFAVLENEAQIEVALELNTLEDVFVNIGLQEEAAEAVQTGAPVHQLAEEIPIPESLNQGFVYSFKKQVSAMFRRRFYCTIRNRTNVLQIIMPFIYLVLSNVLSGQQTDPQGQILMFTIFSMMGFLINTVSYVAFPVHEREINMKYLLRTIGIRPLPYWLGTLAFDIIIVCSYGLLLIPIGYLMQVTLISRTIGGFTFVVLAFGFSLLSQSYIFSWIYSKQATVYKFHILLAMFGFFYLPFFIFIFVVLKSEGSAAGFIAVLLFSFITSPPMLFLYAAFSLADIPIIRADLGDWANSVYFYGVALLFQGLLYFGLNYLIELRSLRLTEKPPKKIQPHIPFDVIPNPQEIQQEEQRVTNPQNQDPTKTINLKKVYENGFQAVRGITFGVEKKQIFGLLGPNGAGKSTTFNMLTGLVPKTDGQIIFNGNNLEVLNPEIFQSSGICPQFNALWDHLSLSEHLEIVGTVKGLDEESIQQAIQYYAKVLRMEEHLNKKAMQLSGGTKRKVCVADLLIGAPVVQFLDEPSTGLDPLSKRALYDTIIRNLEDRDASIILTTHSMSEAEALCNKIGILINGKFVCIGTLPYLKSRYGSGYKIAVVRAGSAEDVYQPAIMEAFPTAIKENDNSEVFSNYRIITQEFSFAKAFRLMERLQNEGSISDFNIMNTTLEQVFIQFSRYQIQNPEIPVSSTSQH